MCDLKVRTEGASGQDRVSLAAFTRAMERGCPSSLRARPICGQLGRICAYCNLPRNQFAYGCTFCRVLMLGKRPRREHTSSREHYK